MEKNYGKVTLSERSALILISTNFDYKNAKKNKRNFEIYTVDSDFMIRIWDCSYDLEMDPAFDDNIKDSLNS